MCQWSIISLHPPSNNIVSCSFYVTVGHLSVHMFMFVWQSKVVCEFTAFIFCWLLKSPSSGSLPLIYGGLPVCLFWWLCVQSLSLSFCSSSLAVIWFMLHYSSMAMAFRVLCLLATPIQLILLVEKKYLCKCQYLHLLRLSVY